MSEISGSDDERAEQLSVDEKKRFATTFMADAQAALISRHNRHARLLSEAPMGQGIHTISPIERQDHQIDISRVQSVYDAEIIVSITDSDPRSEVAAMAAVIKVPVTPLSQDYSFGFIRRFKNDPEGKRTVRSANDRLTPAHMEEFMEVLRKALTRRGLR